MLHILYHFSNSQQVKVSSPYFEACIYFRKKIYFINFQIIFFRFLSSFYLKINSYHFNKRNKQLKCKIKNIWTYYIAIVFLL